MVYKVEGATLERLAFWGECWPKKPKARYYTCGRVCRAPTAWVGASCVRVAPTDTVCRRSGSNTKALSAFRPRGVPGPTSKLSLRVPAQMGQREAGHKGGRTVRRNHGLRVVLCLGRMDALAVGGYKRSCGRERESESLMRRPVLPRGQPSRTRALDLPFIGVRRGSRCTMGGVAVC
jgi:hypothetical protein